MNKKEKNRLRDALIVQNQIKEAAVIRRAEREFRLAEKKRRAADRQPRLRRGKRIRVRNLLQIAVGTLSDRNVERYNALGVAQGEVMRLIAANPRLAEKCEGFLPQTV